jgi:hypothetical protein
MFGAALAVGPEAVAKQAGVNLDPFALGGVSRAGLVSGSLGAAVPDVASSPAFYEKQQLARIKLLKFLNPKWLQESRRDSAKYVSQIDMDLAVLRSVSLAGKVTIQRERNYQRELDREETWASHRLQERLFEAANP